MRRRVSVGVGSAAAPTGPDRGDLGDRQRDGDPDLSEREGPPPGIEDGERHHGRTVHGVDHRAERVRLGALGSTDQGGLCDLPDGEHRVEHRLLPPCRTHSVTDTDGQAQDLHE
jgi:hypothetical protein